MRIPCTWPSRLLLCHLAFLGWIQAQGIPDPEDPVLAADSAISLGDSTFIYEDLTLEKSGSWDAYAADLDTPDSVPTAETGALPELAPLTVRGRGGWGPLPRTDEPTGTYRLAVPDMQRGVSAFGDPVRLVQTLPGVGRPNDWETTLIVRGGAPDQTAFLLDAIPMARTSHFQGMRNEHGGVGMLNLEYVKEIAFHSGPFAAHLPDRMSGVVEMRFRDGDSLARGTRLLADVTGAGAATEGPLARGGNAGSYAAVFRYSSLDLLVRSGLVEAFGTPEYYNGQLRVHVPVGASDFRFHTVGGQERWRNGIGGLAVLNVGGHALATGVDWERPIGRGGGWMRASSHYQNRAQDLDFHYLVSPEKKGADSLTELQDWREDRYGARWEASLPIGTRLRVRGGGEENLVKNRQRIEYGDAQTYLAEADTVITFSRALRLSSPNRSEAAAYLEATWEGDPWEFYAGYRHFYEEISNRHGFGPRVGGKYRPTRRLAFKASAGLHTQAHDFLDICERPDPREAKLPYTAQAAAGWESYLPAGVLVSVEGFAKEAFRLSREKMVQDGGNYAMTRVDTGRAQGRGVEIYLRKPREGGLGFSAAYSYLWHRELDAVGEWKPSAYSIPHNFNVGMEVTLARGLYLGCRQSLTSGVPYTPFNYPASYKASTGVYDMTQAYSASERPFLRTDLRLQLERRLGAMAVSAFMEVENALGRRNFFERRWNSLEGGDAVMEGMGRIPVAGLTLGF